MQFKLIHNCPISLPSYKGCSESHASYFIMLAQSTRDGCWWYGSRGWTFPPISHFILFLCDRWQQKDGLTEWHQTWKCVWSKGVSLNSALQDKMAPTDIHGCLLNGYGDQMVGLSTWDCGDAFQQWQCDCQHVPETQLIWTTVFMSLKIVETTFYHVTSYYRAVLSLLYLMEAIFQRAF